MSQRPDCRRLFEILAGFDSVIVAFSGGVDSALVAWAATQVLGRARTLCVTADSPSYSEHHRGLAQAVARQFDLQHLVIRTGEVEQPAYRANPTNRCYFCKRELYTALTALAVSRDVKVIADGANADDRGDYRPGRQAAREFGVRSPLDEANLTKGDIREISRQAGLPTWDEPASACLSSRIPYRVEVTPEKLRRVERAENLLRDLGFRVVRVRHHDEHASVEIGLEELSRAFDPETAGRIVDGLCELGYREVTIDPRGYRMGSLNEGVVLSLVSG